MNNNYIFNKINAIPKEIRTLLSAALVMLFAFVAMAKSYFNTWTDSNIVDSITIALLSGLLLLVIVPMTKRLTFRIGLRKAALLTMVMAACLVNTSKIYAQAADAANAVQICNGIWPEPSATATTGTNDLPSATSKGCLATGEIGANWYYVKVTTSGKMAFKVDGITSTGAMADIDGAVWGPFTSVATGATAIRSAAGLAPARCNYSAGKGFTLTNSTTVTSVGAGTLLFPTSRNVKSIDVLVGQYYLIYIDNFAAGTVNGAVSISIDFTSENTADYECPAMPTTCGPSCSAATCPVADRGVTKSGVQNAGVLTFSQCTNYFGTPFKAGDGTFTQCYTINSGAYGNFGISQQINVRGTDGADADLLPDCLTPIATSRVATLTLASAACGTAIPPTTANGGNSSTFNPEWSGLTPNTNYVLCIATTMPAVTAGIVCNYRGSCVDVYHWIPPFSGPAPGCAASAPVVWLKANTGTSTTTVGSQVTTWVNQGSTTGNVVGGTGTLANSIANQTTSPLYEQTSSFNYNPSVAFNATAGMGMINAFATNPSKWTIYYVNKLGDLTSWKSHVSLSRATALGTPVGIGATDENSTMSNNAVPYFWQGFSGGATNPIAYTTDKPYISGWQWAAAGTGVSNSINGRAGNTGAALAMNNLKSFILGADPDGGAEDSNGTSYAEAIVFDNTLSAAEHQRVQSYLAIKYGITLDQTVATNYLDGSGSTIWTVASNTGYNNNIFGISKDACQGLDQKQSKSINGGFQPIISTTTFAATNTANTTSLTDKTAELSGSDAGAASLGTAYVFGGMNNRITRVWKIQETGTVGTVKVAIAKNDMPGVNVNLLRSAGNATFDGSDAMLPMAVETIGGVEYYTATIDFADGDYYTFGAFVTAPGCVAAGLDFWLDPAKGVTKTGTTVTGWNDADGNGNNPALTQATATWQPTYADGDALSNYNPYINFTGNRRLNTAVTGANYSSNTTTFGVVNKYAAKGSYNNFIRFSSADNSDAGTHNWGLGTSDLGEDKVAFHYISAPFAAVAPGNIYNRLNGTKLFVLNTPTIMSASLNSVTGATSVGNNGNEVSATGKSGIGTFVPYNYLTVGGGSSFGMDNNKTQEIIHYSRELTIQERQRVQTYLAIKYGITLDAQDNSVAIVEGDYIAGDGTTKIWDKAANTTYHNNVFGIVKDNCQGLDQKQSKSINGGFQPIISTTTFAATNTANTTSLTDKTAELSGSDAGAASLGTAYVFGGMNNRITRVWKIQETGTVGTVKVAVAKNDLGGINPHLLRSAGNATFDGSDAMLPMAVETIGGVEYYTASIDFANGDYYTFGAYVTAPGCVTGGLTAWYKADQGTSTTVNGQDVLGWQDASGNGNNLSKLSTSTLAVSPEFKTNSGFNFNPSINFDGGYNSLGTPKFASANDTLVVFTMSKIANNTHWGALISFARDYTHPQWYYGRPSVYLTGGYDPYLAQPANNLGLDYGINTFNLKRAAGATNQDIWWNGAKTTYSGNGNYLYNATNFWLGNDGSDNGLSSSEMFNGNIMETIVYKNSQMTDAKIRQIQTYLAIKYGVTLSHDYIAGDGTTKIWDLAATPTFNKNITVISRDDCQSLNQKQSKSVNTTAKMTIGIDNEIAVTNAANTGAFATNASFLAVGDNGLTGVTTLVPGGACTPAGPDKGTNRIWKFVETGTVESVKVSTDLSPDFNGVSTQVFMQVSTDAAFTGVVANIPARFNSVSGQFETNYDFTGTQYVRYIGVQTPPANACIGGSKDLNWLSFAPFNWWYWGTRSKTYNLGDGLNAQVTIDDPNNKILYKNTPAYNPPVTPNPTTGYYPVNYGNHLYIPRYDGNPTSTITTKIKLVDATSVAMPANGVSFKIKDIDGWWWGKDNVKVYGKLGGSIVNPKLSTNKLYTNVTITQPNQGKGSIWPWDWTVLGDMYVNFDSPVDEIYVEHTKDNLFSFKVFNDIAIGGLDIQCKAPEPEVVTPDNVYLFKEVSPKTARAGEAFTYKFTFKNYNCTDKIVSFTDALPSGMVWKDSTLATTMTIGTTSAYGSSANLNLTGLVVPVGTTYMYAEAVASTTGTLNNQASFTVNGNTYQSDEPSIAGAANATPVTILAAPQVANLTLTKSVNKSSAPQNSLIEYTLSVTNNGTSTVNAQVQDFLEGDAEYTADPLVFTPASASTGTVVNTYATTGTLDVRDLAVAAGATVTIKVKAKLGTNPVVNDTLSNNFVANTGLGADAEFYAYK